MLAADNNKAVVRQFYDAVGRGDLRAVLALLGDEVVWANHSVGSPLSGEHKGRRGVRALLVEAAVVTDRRRAEITHVVAEGDRVVAFTEEAFTVRATRDPYEGPVVYSFEVTDDLIVRVDEFPGNLDPSMWTW